MSKTDQITYSELRIESTTRLSEKPLPTCMYISQGAPIRITGCSQAVNCPDTVLAENGNSRNFPLSFSAYVILELLFFCQALSNLVDRLLCLRNGLFFTFSTFFFPKNKKNSRLPKRTATKNLLARLLWREQLATVPTAT